MKEQSYPTLAVIVPARNSLPLLGETLDSLTNQTELADEIILSDNSSNDGTGEKFKQFASNQKNTLLVRTPKYLELGASFNFAISHSKSDWVFFLHSDDILSRYAIKNIRKAISKVDEYTGLISFKAEIISKESKLKRAVFSIGRTRHEYGINFILKNISTSTINFGAVAINRKIFYKLGQFDVENSYWLDLKYFHKLVINYKILRVPITVLRYRTYSNERTSDNRIDVALKNEIYWNQKYLPSLFKVLPDLKTNNDNSNIKSHILRLASLRRPAILFMEYIVTQRLLVLSLVKLRTFFDRLGLGNFGF
jgi:glycosyltransferase involved in cell wall biosynthesis